MWLYGSTLYALFFQSFESPASLFSLKYYWLKYLVRFFLFCVSFFSLNVLGCFIFYFLFCKWSSLIDSQAIIFGKLYYFFQKLFPSIFSPGTLIGKLLDRLDWTFKSNFFPIFFVFFFYFLNNFLYLATFLLNSFDNFGYIFNFQNSSFKYLWDYLQCLKIIFSSFW